MAAGTDKVKIIRLDSGTSARWVLHYYKGWGNIMRRRELSYENYATAVGTLKYLIAYGHKLKKGYAATQKTDRPVCRGCDRWATHLWRMKSGGRGRGGRPVKRGHPICVQCVALWQRYGRRHYGLYDLAQGKVVDGR